jgi:phosphate acetyltransferase
LKRTLYLAPAASSAGLTTVTLGLVRALDRIGFRVGFYKPIGQSVSAGDKFERSSHFIRQTTNFHSADPISFDHATRFMSEGHMDELMSRVIDGFQSSSENADIMIVEGLVPTLDNPYASALNVELVKTLSAEVILVGNMAGLHVDQLRGQIELAARPFGSIDDSRLAGCVLNRVTVPDGETLESVTTELRHECARLRKGGLPLIAAIPSNIDLTHYRTVDLARHLDAKILHAGDIETRRVKSVSVLARTVPNMLGAFRPGAALVTPIDRTDVIVAVAMAVMNHIPIAGLILTGGLDVDERVMELCRPGLNTGLPVLVVPTSSYETASSLYRMNSEVAPDDIERIYQAMDFVAEHIDPDWLRELPLTAIDTRTSPAAFCHMLTERARSARKRILLPEGSEPRTIRAAVTCQEREIATCVLLGNPDEIRQVARGQDLVLPPGLEIIDPDQVRESYVDALVEFRKNKNLSREAALDQLTDHVMLGTVMLALGQGDGLVSGAIHSSANTVRPALQVIKTRPGAKVVSSIFFMLLPDQVVVYGDCAVNTDPDAEALADIAIQSADSAAQFGIEPRVAMISYSTGESGSGAGVDKVREATRIAKEKRPDLLIDGPLQYDAAAIADVAEKKAPDSPVAGRATVFIFPDLNTGNTTYKAVQRSANVISIGPMLQGLKRPVNDLSRGALVEDIIYTIALTAIQSTHNTHVVQ